MPLQTMTITLDLTTDFVGSPEELREEIEEALSDLGEVSGVRIAP